MALVAVANSNRQLLAPATAPLWPAALASAASSPEKQSGSGSGAPDGSSGGAAAGTSSGGAAGTAGANSSSGGAAGAGAAATVDLAQRLRDAGAPLNLQFLGQHVGAERGAGGVGVIVDCTASDVVPSYYEGWLGAGLHVVTPNKKMGAGDARRLAAARAAGRAAGARLLAEASVGAGLPVLCTLRDLLESGDEVLRVEGVLSGTLSFLFNEYRPDGGEPFSAVVARAKALGYTEPDPRDDLSGADVARKVVILARACGVGGASMESLRVASLVPEPLRAPGTTVDEFMARLPEFDAEMEAQARAAAARGGVLRYVGAVDVAAGTASVSLQT